MKRLPFKYYNSVIHWIFGIVSPSRLANECAKEEVPVAQAIVIKVINNIEGQIEDEIK